MATMFGTDATTLREPQGAGSRPLSPVQQQYYGEGNSGLINTVGGLLVSGAEAVAEADKKNKKVPEWMGVRNEFQTRLAKLSEAANQSTDNVSRNRYMTQARSLYNQYMANYSYFGEDFSKSISNAYTFNKTGSGLDEVEDVRKREVEFNQKTVQEYTAQGLVPNFGDLTPDQTKATLALAQQWNQTKKLNEQMLAEEDRQIKRNAEGRAQVGHAFTTTQQTMQLQAQQQLAGTLASGVDLLVTNTDAAKEKIDNGAVPYEEAVFILERSILTQRQQGNIALQGDAQALSTYNTFMDNYLKITKDYLNPATRSKAIEDEYQRMIALEKLNIARRPAGAKSIVLSDLFGKDVMTNLNTSRFVTSIGNDIDAAYSQNMVPSILSGDTGTQAATFSSVQEQVTKAKNGELPAGNKAFEQAGQFSNSVLNTIGSVDPTNPKSLAYANDYMASEAFAELVKQGRISPAMAAKAKEPFLQNYAQGLGRNMEKFLYTTVGEATYTNGQRDTAKTPTNVNLLKFTPKPDGSFSVSESRDPNSTFVLSPYHAASLRASAEKQATELGKTVRSYAHLNGHTNYEQAWNEVRHILVPGQFPTPNRVKEAMADGWDGVGFFNNASSWKSGHVPN